MKTLVASFILSTVIFTGVALAQDGIEEIIESETTTLDDLEGGNPRLLPTSPFYFLKEMGRGIQRAFTFNSVAKTALELRIANEKAAELKKVEDNNPNDTSAIQRALENYQNGQERLKRRFESLRETSENPNVDRLLEQLADRAVRHEKLLEELEARHETIKSAIQNARAKVEDTVGAASELDVPEKFKARFERAFEKSKGSALKHLRSVDIAERIADKAPDRIREQFEDLQEELSEKVRSRVEEIVGGEEGSEKLKALLEHIPGDALRRSVQFEDLRGRVSERAAKTLEEVRDTLDRSIQTRGDLSERAAEQIERAEKIIERTEIKIGGEEGRESTSSLLENAKTHLEDAKAALEEESGRAFGLARSAEAVARNILRIVDMGDNLREEIPERLDRIRDRIIDTRPDGDDTDRPAVRDCPLGYPSPEFFARCEARGGEVLSRIPEGGRCPIPTCSISITDRERERIIDGTEREICPAIDLGSLTRECNAKGGEIIRQETSNCGLIPVCRKPESLPPQEIPEDEDVIPEVPEEIPPVIELENPEEDLTLEVPEEISPLPEVERITIEADDTSMSPSEIRAKKGATVSITFNVSTSVYFGGLDFRSDVFDTGRILPGDSTTVEFTADESFEIKSYWPASQVLKATAQVIVE